MAGRHVDAGNRVKIPHGKGKLRHRPHGREEPDRDSVAGKDFRCQLRILTGVVSAVIGNCHTAMQISAGFLQIVGDSLRRPSDGERIHAVCARAADASQSRCSEFYLLIKAIIDLLLITSDRQQFFPHGIVLRKPV